MRIAIATCSFLLLILTSSRLPANDVPIGVIVNVGDTLTDSLSGEQAHAADSATKNFHKEKLIASILAFPIPFGFSGLHRIYLGTEPWIPVAYLITGGGGVGLLPLLDFIFIVTADEEEFKSYENNPHFFMWEK